jgi:hypothetical protein
MVAALLIVLVLMDDYMKHPLAWRALARQLKAAAGR